MNGQDTEGVPPRGRGASRILSRMGAGVAIPGVSTRTSSSSSPPPPPSSAYRPELPSSLTEPEADGCESVGAWYTRERPNVAEALSLRPGRTCAEVGARPAASDERRAVDRVASPPAEAATCVARSLSPTTSLSSSSCDGRLSTPQLTMEDLRLRFLPAVAAMGMKLTCSSGIVDESDDPLHPCHAVFELKHPDTSSVLTVTSKAADMNRAMRQLERKLSAFFV